MKYAHFKRIMDFIFALIGVFIATPFCIIIALMIKLDSKGPVFFCQKRVGKNGNSFILYKFRTMGAISRQDVTSKDAHHTVDNITRVGKFLRKSSIDELPQLVNVLKGDMSLIGPRPVVLEERALISLRMQQGVYDVKPGISGWAQINGRDTLTVEQKVRLDREYIEKMGLIFDAKCFIKTFTYVILCKDIHESCISTHQAESSPVHEKKLVYAGASENTN